MLQDRARLLAQNLTFEEMISSRAVRVVLLNFSNSMFVSQRYPAENKPVNVARIKIRKCFKKFKLFGCTL